MARAKLTNHDWADFVRACGLMLEYEGACQALALVFAMVQLERIYGMKTDPRKLDADHLLIVLYFGADVLDRP